MHKQSLALFASLLLLSVNAGAAYYSTDYLNIEADPRSYTSGVWVYGTGTPHTVPSFTHAPLEILSDGVRFSPSEHIASDDQFGGLGALSFDVDDLKFFAKPGYQITGYELSFSGYSFASSGAYGSMQGSLMGGDEKDQLTFQGDHFSGWKPYTYSTTFAAANPAGGEVTAQGSLFYDAPTFDDGHYWFVSSAEITMNSVTVKALVAPIPEPETYLMFLAGIGAIAWRLRRADKPASKV